MARYLYQQGIQSQVQHHGLQKLIWEFTVQRGEATDVDIHVWKCRFKWIGKQGIARLEYYPPTGVYSEQTIDDVDNYDWTF